MDRFVEEAVVLSTVDYGEADRLVTLFSRERGKLTAFAAGARKSRRRFGGALESCTAFKAHLKERRGETYRLESVEVVRAFAGLRSDLALISRALYAVELCRELVREREPHPVLFDRLIAFLGHLELRQAGPTSLIAFELSALAQAGLMPRFSPCAVCGGPTGAQPRFDPAHGGIVCQLCHARSPRGLVITPALVEALAGLQAGERQPLGSALRARARELLNAFVAHHLGRRLKSVDFMEQVGTD